MDKHGYANLRKGRCSIPEQIYHIVSRTHDREKIFSDWLLASKASAAFTSSQALKDSVLLCWVLMPDHAHWLVQLGATDDLSCLIQRMKSLSAKSVHRWLKNNDPVWHRGFYDRALRKEDDLLVVARYIVANPLRANLCRSVRDYPFWNAVYL